MITRWIALAALLPVASIACAGGADRATDTAAVTQAGSDTAGFGAASERARGAANALGMELQKKLFAALDAGGPTKAVAFCADSAQAWTARHAAAGVYVRRVSLKVRNPANAPDAAEERHLRVLDSLHAAKALAGEVLRATTGPNGEPMVEYLRPIVVQERCLQCHGDPATFAPAVKQLLAERYPADQATGYKAGDLRGMLSVRVNR